MEIILKSSLCILSDITFLVLGLVSISIFVIARPPTPPSLLTPIPLLPEISKLTCTDIIYFVNKIIYNTIVFRLLLLFVFILFIIFLGGLWGGWGLVFVLTNKKNPLKICNCTITEIASALGIFQANGRRNEELRSVRTNLVVKGK